MSAGLQWKVCRRGNSILNKMQNIILITQYATVKILWCLRDECLQPTVKYLFAPVHLRVWSLSAPSVCKVCNKLFTKGHLAVKHGAMSRCGAEESGDTVYWVVNMWTQKVLEIQKLQEMRLGILVKIFPQQYLIVFLFPSNIKLVEIRNGARSKTLNWYKIRI